MGELLLRKVLLCRDRMEKIRRVLPATPEQITDDERLEAFLAFNLFLLVQDSVDLAAHLVAERALGIPASQRDVFDVLAKSKLLSADSARAMGQMASLRNRIAHSYSDLDPVRMVREAPTGLAATARFLDEVTQLADNGKAR